MAHAALSDAQTLAALERAKGVLMERHDIAEPEAYELLRRRAREERRLADAVLIARTLIPRRPGAPDGH